MHHLDEMLECRRIRLNLEVFELFLVADKDLVHAIMLQFFGFLRDFAPEEQRVDWLRDLFRKLPCLAEELIRHRVDAPFDVVDIHGDAAPFALVDRRLLFVLDILHRALRAFFHAEAAHAAGSRELDLAIFFHHRAEWADFDKRLHVINFVLMYNKLCHISFPPAVKP